MSNLFVFEVSDALAADVGNAHPDCSGENQKPDDQPLAMLSALGVMRIDVKRIVVHGQHAEEGVVHLGNVSSGPVPVDVADGEFLVVPAKFHFATTKTRRH